MRSFILYRLAIAAAVLLACAWLVTNYHWVEREENDAPRGAAVDPFYALRQVLQAEGATLERRTSLEPMPPRDATLVLDSGLWSIFPERDARLKAWVENGGHLVVLGRHARKGNDLRWVPLSVAQPWGEHNPSHGASAAMVAASAPDEEDAASAPDDAASQPHEQATLPKPADGEQPWQRCVDLDETDATTEPAFQPGRSYRACNQFVGRVRPLGQAKPVWQLSHAGRTLAMRIPLGRGSVTGVPFSLVTDNLALRRGDNALIAAAVLQAAPGRVVWILGDEAREPLVGWLWHEARTPTLLTALAIVLGLWRLMVRFGPREAVPPQARRSMGERVRGTGRFVAALDPRALHAATRTAFEDAARKRIEHWAALDDAQRVAALAAAVAHAHAIDQPQLLVSLNIGGGATPAQVLAATGVLEQVRRALLRTPPAP